MVISQQATEPLAALNLTTTAADFVTGLNDLVRQSLMISFRVIMQ